MPDISDVSVKQAGDLIVSLVRKNIMSEQEVGDVPTPALVIQEGWVLDLGLGKQDNVHLKSHGVMFQMPATAPLWLL